MAKTASLVFFYFGEDSYVNRIAQETVPVWKALEGYDKTVLLRHETDIGSGKMKIELSEKAEKLATVLDIPTKENLAKYLNELGAEGYEVDVFIFSHGWKNTFRCSKGTYGDNGTVSQAYLEANVRPLQIRMVWQCNCYGSTMNDCWVNLGAKAAGGSKFVSFYPTRFSGFMKHWKDGKSFGTALTRSDTKLVHTPAQAFMVVEAARRAKEWDGNALQALKVLGNNDHSRRFFRECWNGDDVPDGMSGKQIMNDSSLMLVGGDRNITCNSQVTW
ncbi:MAG: hypothetical protein E4G90_03545 [Gemmatimonadales bacterium]|nr:MAG: hypothetical protein E4G90_03545 [Gemmatimonadales bacterium]